MRLAGEGPGGAGADHRAFLHALDLVSEGLAFFDTAGMLLHTNRTLIQALQQAEEGDELREEILSLALSLGSAVRAGAHAPVEAVRSGALESREIRTAAGSYRLRGSYLAADLFGLGGAVLIALDPPAFPLLADEALRQRFGLSRQESRIARRLAAGRSNAEVAAELGISPHTARRHTERIFAKLGIRSRAEVGQRLHGNASLDARSGTRRSR